MKTGIFGGVANYTQEEIEKLREGKEIVREINKKIIEQLEEQYDKKLGLGFELIEDPYIQSLPKKYKSLFFIDIKNNSNSEECTSMQVNDFIYSLGHVCPLYSLTNENKNGIFFGSDYILYVLEKLMENKDKNGLKDKSLWYRYCIVKYYNSYIENFPQLALEYIDKYNAITFKFKNYFKDKNAITNYDLVFNVDLVIQFNLERKKELIYNFLDINIEKSVEFLNINIFKYIHKKAFEGHKGELIIPKNWKDEV